MERRLAAPEAYVGEARELVEERVDGRLESAPVELEGSEQGWQNVGERADVPPLEKAVREAHFGDRGAESAESADLCRYGRGAPDHEVAGNNELHRVACAKELADRVRFVGARTRCVAREDDRCLVCTIGSVGPERSVGSIGSIGPERSVGSIGPGEDGPDARRAGAGDAGAVHEDPWIHARERSRVHRVDSVACLLRYQAERATLVFPEQLEDAGEHDRRPFGPWCTRKKVKKMRKRAKKRREPWVTVGNRGGPVGPVGDRGGPWGTVPEHSRVFFSFLLRALRLGLLFNVDRVEPCRKKKKVFFFF